MWWLLCYSDKQNWVFSILVLYCVTYLQSRLTRILSVYYNSGIQLDQVLTICLEVELHKFKITVGLGKTPRLYILVNLANWELFNRLIMLWSCFFNCDVLHHWSCSVLIFTETREWPVDSEFSVYFFRNDRTFYLKLMLIRGYTLKNKIIITACTCVCADRLGY